MVAIAGEWHGTMSGVVAASYVFPNEGGWIRRELPRECGMPRALTWTDGHFVAIGDTVATSSDGLEWSCASGGGDWVEDAAAGGDLVVAVGELGKVATVAGGAWAETELPIGELMAVTGSADGPVSVGAFGLVLQRIGDDLWRRISSPVVTHLRAVAEDGDGLIAVGDGGTILRSSGAAELVPEDAGTSERLNGVATSGDSDVVVGARGTILAHVGDAAWMPAGSGIADDLNDVAACADGFLAVGNHGTLVTSHDGLSWEVLTVTAADLFAVDCRSATAVAVGAGGVVVTRDPGGDWREVATGAAGDLRDVAWTGSGFAAVGDRATSLCSPGGWTWGRCPSPAFMPDHLALNSVAPGESLLMVGDHGWAAFDPWTPPVIVTGEEIVSVIPAVAHAPGVSSTLWRSDLAGGFADAVLVPMGGSLARSVVRRFAADDVAKYADVVRTAFAEDEAVGAVLVTAAGRNLTSRTFNNGEGGTYGQSIPAVPAAEAFAAGEEAVLLNLARTAGLRSNLGFVNLSAHEVEVVVELFSNDGTPLGVRSRSCAPFSPEQLKDVLAGLGSGEVRGAFARVVSHSDGARIVPYASVVDNTSGDPYLVLASRPSADALWVPVVAHSAGAQGTVWRSDLCVFNPGPGPLAFSLDLLPRDDSAEPSSMSAAFTIASGTSACYPDVVATVFARSGAGALRITPTAGSLSAHSRTFNDLGTSSYGEATPTRTLAQALTPARGGEAVNLGHSADPTSGFRTNLGLVNPSGHEAQVVITLFGDRGEPLWTSPAIAVPAYRTLQLNRVFAGHAPGSLSNGRCRVRVEPSGGPPPTVFAYASVVDNRTGDPTLVMVE